MTTHTSRGYQTRLMADVQEAWASGKRNVLAVLPTGGGKCLGRDTPVLMYDGRVLPVQDVAVGDLLMGPDSTPRRVLSLARGREAMYRVVPVKGDPYVVNESHILSLRCTPARKVPRSPSDLGGHVVNISVRDYLQQSKTFKHKHKGYRAAVDFAPSAEPLPVDPYFLGLWLGDGSANSTHVTSADTEVFAECCAQARKHGMTVKVVAPPGSRGLTFRITSGKESARGSNRSGRNPLLTAMQGLNLIDNKHIPLRYLTASRADRLALLAGLLDSDGYNSGKGYDVVLKAEVLMDGLLFLARSLGFAAYKKPCQKTCTNNGVVGDYFRCSISGHLDQIPCRIARNVAPPRQQIKDVLVTGIQVEAIGEGDYYGFEIDGDHLFLLGDFTVTHNTHVLSQLVERARTPAICIAHRAELVAQMSTALAREGVRHRVIGPDALRKSCVDNHMSELGASFYDPTSPYAVAGVDTLVRMPENDPLFSQIGLWVTDEAHHLVRANKWGKSVAMFPNAIGLGVTATPTRADGMGLGRHADGVFDDMIVGPGMRELIEAGYLTDYRAYVPKSDLDLASVNISASGDYNPEQLRAARKRSHLTGDVVAHYLRLASGKLGVTFDTDIDSAIETCKAYREAGVPAEVLSGKTPAALRRTILQRFKAREVHQIVSVDVISEGFDLPAIEVVSFARATMSFSLFAQQLGRALRLMLPAELMAVWESLTPEQRRAHIATSGKPHAIVIDHVGNIMRHGPPDRPRPWTLNARERRVGSNAADDAIPLRVCESPMCNAPYERVLLACPYCGTVPTPAERSKPEFVDGDLALLDPTVLAAMRGEIDRIDGDPIVPFGAPQPVQFAVRKRHAERQQEQVELRRLIALWGGWQTVQGRAVAEAQRRFFHGFGVDVASAQVLGATEARTLAERVRNDLKRNGVSDE